MIVANRVFLSMVICHFHNFDCGYLVGIDSSVFTLWDRIVSRLKNEPVWVNQIHCILSLSIACKLVSSIRFGCGHHC